MTFPLSSLTNMEDFTHERYLYWCNELHQDASHIHRKLWEWVVMCETLDRAGLLVPGTKALGFGVGKEPLVSYFASKRIHVTATDHVTDTGAWAGTFEGAAFRVPNLVDEKAFKRYVRYQDVDMNAIPLDLKNEQFDFIWSSCSMEHLGSRVHGVKFFIEALQCVRLGGLSVHTTEYTFDLGFDSRDLSFYTAHDLKNLQSMVRSMGWKMDELDFTVGDHPYNYVENKTHYEVQGKPHIRVTLAGRNFTSCLLTVRKEI